MNATLTPQTIEPRYGWITAMALSPGGRFLACASSQGYRHASAVVELWDMQRSRHTLLCSAGDSDDYGRIPQAQALAWSFDSSHLGIGREDGTLEVWQVGWEGPEPGRRVFAHQAKDRIIALAWSQQTPRLAAATRDRPLFWQPDRDLVAREYPPEQQGRSYDNRHVVRALAYSPDDRLLATGDEEGHLVLWSVEGAAEPWVVTWWVFSSEIHTLSLAWSPGSERLLANGHWMDEGRDVHHEHTAIRFVRTGHTLQLSTDTTRINDLVGWSPDGSCFASTRFDERFEEELNGRVFLDLWEAATGDLRASYEFSPLTLPIEKAWFFDSLQGVLSADGRQVVWCAEVGAMGSHQDGPELPPLWYGTLPLD